MICKKTCWIEGWLVSDCIESWKGGAILGDRVPPYWGDKGSYLMWVGV